MAAPRARRRWPWLLLPVVLLLAGIAALRLLLEPARLSEYLLREAEAATGLDFTLATPARIGVWPDLHLALDGLEARAPGAATPLLRVAQLDAVLPWSALRADRVQLRSLRLQAPELDWSALRAWSESRSALGPPAPLRLPRLDAALAVHEGRIVGPGWRLEDLELRLDGLRGGTPTQLQVRGGYAAADVRRALELELSGTPREQLGTLTLETLRLQAAAPLALELRGRAEWQPPQRLEFSLEGELPEWPEGWPPSPLAPDSPAPAHGLALGFRGTPDLQGTLRLRLARGEASLGGEIAIGDLAAWMRDPARPPLPPLRGELQAERLDAGSVRLQGVRLRFSEADTPAAPEADDAGR